MILDLKRVGLAFGLLYLCTPSQGKSDNSSLRGETEESRKLSGNLGPGRDVFINFDELPAKTYVSNQYNSAQYPYNVIMSSMGGRGSLPRIFDSSNPVTGEYGDSDLGTPNEACPGGGPGWGTGGEPHQPGENCVPLYNLLIIQEKNDNPDVPDDEANGGKIVFDFTTPVFFRSMGFVDNDYGGELIVEHSGRTTKFTLPMLGDNAYEEQEINLEGVTRITFNVVRSGAVAFLSYFIPEDPPTPPPTPPPQVIEIPYFLIAVLGVDTCFDPYVWCEIDLFEILMKALEELDDITPEEFDIILNGLQAYFCDAATASIAASMAVVRGQGVYVLNRGAGGNVNSISLDVGLDTAALALATADAYADSYSDAYAYAFAEAGVCSRYASNTLKYKLCALAKGEAYSDAIAYASATGSATGEAGAGTSSSASVFVDADKINEFSALFSTSASSFAAADASATAYTYASAYAEALAAAKVSSKIKQYHCCRHKKRHCDKKCRWGKCKCDYYWKCMGHCDWWDTVYETKFKVIAEAISSEVNDSYSAAYASALTSVLVKADMGAYFLDLPGPDDIVMFGADADIAIDFSLQCLAESS